MITVALSVTIGAPIGRVWSALTDSSERAVWDERILGAVTPSRRTRQNEKTSESETRWRFKLGSVPLVMKDEVVELVRNDRLVSRISMGSLHFDQTFILHRDDDDLGPRARLGMKIVAHNRIAVIGEVIQRLDVQKLVIEYVDTTLRQIQKHCEGQH